MIIDRIELVHLKLPLNSPWKTAYGTEDSVESLFLKAHSGKLSAWTETCALSKPDYLPECSHSARIAIDQFFMELFLGKDFQTADEIHEAFSIYKGNTFAKSALELCWWALTCKEENKALHQTIGGTKKAVEAGIAISLQKNNAALLKKIDAALKTGYKRVKLKISPGKDREMIAEVRQEFPKINLQVDCNGAYTRNDIDVLKSLDEFNLGLIEQPFYYTDIADHAELQAVIDTDICLDESIRSYHDAEQAIRLGACRSIALKMGRVGGLSQLLKIHDLCKQNNIGCWIGGMLESPVGTMINAHLASLPGITNASDLPIGDERYSLDFCEEVTAEKAKIHLTKDSWIKQDIDEDKLKDQAIFMQEYTVF